MTSKPSIELRAVAVFLGCLLLAGAVLSRAVWIQLVRDPRLEAMAKRQFQSRMLMRPKRGMIVDRNGEPLAVNTDTQSLAANPSKVRDPRTLARLLSKATDVPYAKLLERLKGTREFVWIKRHLGEAEMGRLKRWGIVTASGDLVDGLWMVRESQRAYPHGELAAHVLGDVNLDSEGLEGTELWANAALQGKVVSMSAIKDALGRPAFLDAKAAREAKDGETVALTLDASLQFAVEQELKHSVQKTGARAGTAIVMNATTGEILAMANEPSFNPNDKSAPVARRRNRALTDGYEPGSAIKAILLASALSRGMKLTDSVYGEKGSFVVQGKRISEAEAHEKFEWITLKRMLQVSSNVGAAKLALKLGTEPFLHTLRSFGFGDKTGSGFPGEINGKLPPSDKGPWQPLTLANVGFGQGLLATPMQVVRAYAALANGGLLVKPRLLLNAEPTTPLRILSERAAESVVEALKSVVSVDGTGIKAKVDGYEIAGKTATSQVVDSATGKYSRTRYVASFVGFAAGIEPRLVVYTALDEPRGSYYATDTAAPLFRGVMTAAAGRFSLPAETPPVVATAKPVVLQDKLRTSLAKVVSPPVADDPKLEWNGVSPKGELTWKMPELAGLTPREAMVLLKGRKFQIEIRGTGLVKTQYPEAGRSLAEGTAVKLQLAEPAL
jgi:cell division protein FtsI (penicillin-binding protein 3)